MTYSLNKQQACKFLVTAAILVSGMSVATSSHARHGGNNSNCVNYRLHSTGDAGIRTINARQDNFTRSRHGRASGRLCGRDRLNVELSKRHVGTRVSLDVGGRHYVFRRGDRGDRVANSWYRRYITISLDNSRRHRGDRHDDRNHRYDRDHRSHRYSSRDNRRDRYSQHNRFDRHNRYSGHNGYGRGH